MTIDWQDLCGRLLVAFRLEEGTLHDHAWKDYGVTVDERHAALREYFAAWERLYSDPPSKYAGPGSPCPECTECYDSPVRQACPVCFRDPPRGQLVVTGYPEMHIVDGVLTAVFKGPTDDP